MQQEAKTALEKLLATAEPEKTRSRDITLPASRLTGYPYSNAEKTQLFHATLKLAEEAGAIRLEWHRYYEGHELERIRLLDPRMLADFLGKPFLPDAVNALFDALDINDAPDWLAVSLDDLRVAWCKGITLYGMKYQDADRLKDIIKAITVLETSPLEHTLDYRQFGARILGDSKRTRLIERSLAGMYRHHWQASGLSDKDIMQQLNIVPMAHPVLVKGPFRIRHQGRSLDANVSPYIGVHDLWLETVEITSEPSYVLTIENLSSFNEYTQTIQDNAIVLYTGGFPTSAFQRFYGAVVNLVTAPLLHWGDTDAHGFMILKTLQNCVPTKSLRPHLMDHPKGAPYSKAALRDLERIKPINSTVDGLLDILIERGAGMIEQEEVAALSPMLTLS